MKKVVNKFKRVAIVSTALVCALSATTAISANAAAGFQFKNITKSKVDATATSTVTTTIVINPLQCRSTNGTEYINVKDTNSVGSGKEVYACVTPGSGWKLVSSSTYDFMKYSVAGKSYTTYYWKSS